MFIVFQLVWRNIPRSGRGTPIKFRALCTLLTIETPLIHFYLHLCQYICYSHWKVSLHAKLVWCYAKHIFPAELDIYCSQNHWANEKCAIRFIDKIIIPYVKTTREKMSNPWVMSYLPLCCYWLALISLTKYNSGAKTYFALIYNNDTAFIVLTVLRHVRYPPCASHT